MRDAQHEAFELNLQEIVALLRKAYEEGTYGAFRISLEYGEIKEYALTQTFKPKKK